MMRSKLLGGIVAAIAVVAIGGFAAYYFLLRNDSPPPVSVEQAVQAVKNGTPSAGGTVSTSDASTLAGTWKLVAGANSFVGYRVNENLAGVGAAQAVGRTTGLDGTLTYDGKAITAAMINADVSQLKSDKTQRDNALKQQALETTKFPGASFVLSSPITIDKVPVDGETVTQSVSGKLTLHGVTKDVKVDVQGVLANDQLVVVGSTPILFSDYGMNSPRAAAVLSVEDHGTMELQLQFTRAS
jgi:polyisoprenoid-binding protein YceI